MTLRVQLLIFFVFFSLVLTKLTNGEETALCLSKSLKKNYYFFQLYSGKETNSSEFIKKSKFSAMNSNTVFASNTAFMGIYRTYHFTL